MYWCMPKCVVVLCASVHTKYVVVLCVVAVPAHCAGFLLQLPHHSWHRPVQLRQLALHSDPVWFAWCGVLYVWCVVWCDVYGMC